MAKPLRIALNIDAEGANRTAAEIAAIAKQIDDVGSTNAEISVNSQDLKALAEKAASAKSQLGQLAAFTGLNFQGAKQLAEDLSLTQAEAAQAANRLNQLKLAGATVDQQFAALRSELNLTEQQFQELAKASDRAAQKVGNVGGTADKAGRQGRVSLGDLATGFNQAIELAQKFQGVLVGAYDLLIGSNERLNQQLLASQANLASTARIFENGVEVTDPLAKVRASQGQLSAALKQLEADTQSLVGVTSAQVNEVFSITLQNAAQLNNQSKEFPDSIQAATSLTKGWTAALGSLGVPLDQARQEINSILNGTIDSNSALAKSLGITNKQVQDWKAQGVLVDELNSQLEVYVAANSEAAKSVAGASSNILDLFQRLGREAGAPISAVLVEGLLDLEQVLKNAETLISEITQAASAEFLVLYEILEGEINSALQELGPSLQGSWEAFKPLISTSLAQFKQIAPLAIETGKNVVLALSQIFQALAPLAQILQTIQGLATQVVFGAINSIAVITTKILEFRANLLGTIESFAEKLSFLPDGIFEKIFGTPKADEAVGAITKVKDAAESVPSQKEIEFRPKGLEDLGTAAEQIADKVDQAFKTLSDGAGGDTERAKGAAEQIIDLTEQQLKLGQISEAEALQRLAKISGNTKLSYEQQVAAAEAAESIKSDAANRSADAQEKAAERAKKAQEEAAAAAAAAISRASDEIAAVEAERNLQIAKAVAAGVSEDEIQRQKLDAVEARIRDEIALEAERIAKAVALEPDPEEREALIRNARTKTIQLETELAQVAYEREQALQEALAAEEERREQALQEALAAEEERRQERLEAIKSEAQAKELAVNRAVAAINREVAAQEAITASIERQGRLRQAQADLQSAASDLAQARGQREVERLARAAEIQSQLNSDEELSAEKRRALLQELARLGVDRGESELSLLQRQQAAEDRLAEQKFRALAAEQEQQQIGLQLDQQREQIQARLNERKARQAELEAQINAIRAEAELQAAIEEGNEQAINAARQQLELARQSQDLAAQGVQEALADARALGDAQALAQQQLALQQQAAREQFAAENAQREAQQSQTLADAGIDARRNRAADIPGIAEVQGELPPLRIDPAQLAQIAPAPAQQDQIAAALQKLSAQPTVQQDNQITFVNQIADPNQENFLAQVRRISETTLLASLRQFAETQ